MDLFVTCPTNLEELLITELSSFGLRNIRKGFRGVFVPETMEAVYTINYRSHLATRVLWNLATFPCPDKDALYKKAKEIPWSSYLKIDKTFAIDSNVTHPNLRNSLFAALVVKDAICDNLRDECGSRPSIDVTSPDVQLNLFIQNGMARISIDTSRTPLYKRGYRTKAHEAPLQENIAAAILKSADYTSASVLCDPFCGSGTLLIEAALLATSTPAGYFRKHFGFFDMPQFDASAWQKVKNHADGQKTDLTPGTIFGADKDPEAIAMTKTHLETTGFDTSIEVVTKDIRSYFPPLPPTLIVSNPPYGKRLNTSLDLYKAIGHFLKTKCAQNAKAYFLGTDLKLIKEIGYPIDKTYPLVNGGLDVNLYTLIL